jgi:hypothetical protein
MTATRLNCLAPKLGTPVNVLILPAFPLQFIDPSPGEYLFIT